MPLPPGPLGSTRAAQQRSTGGSGSRSFRPATSTNAGSKAAPHGPWGDADRRVAQPG